MDIRIILNRENGTIDLLRNGYNIIEFTIYNKELVDKILHSLEKEVKDECFDPDNFENLEQFLDY